MGFLTKNHKNNQQIATNDESTTFFDDDSDSITNISFSLNDFLMKFAVEKFCDIVTKLKRTSRTFVQNNVSISGDKQQSVPIFQVLGGGGDV